MVLPIIPEKWKFEVLDCMETISKLIKKILCLVICFHCSMFIVYQPNSPFHTFFEILAHCELAVICIIFTYVCQASNSRDQLNTGLKAYKDKLG